MKENKQSHLENEYVSDWGVEGNLSTNAQAQEVIAPWTIMGN